MPVYYQPFHLPLQPSAYVLWYLSSSIGIDQGEIISPLLWVIYLDPLLTEFNTSASSPYILSNSLLTSFSPRVSSNVSIPISHLTFMDDPTLISFETRLRNFTLNN